MLEKDNEIWVKFKTLSLLLIFPHFFTYNIYSIDYLWNEYMNIQKQFISVYYFVVHILQSYIEHFAHCIINILTCLNLDNLHN